MSIENEPLPQKRNLEDLLQDDPVILEIKSRLLRTFQPLHIYLFGSRAYGSPREDSDYDFLIVVDKTDLSRWENMSKARQALADLKLSTEVFVYSKDEFNDWKNELNSIAEAAFNLGIEIPLGK